MIYQMTLPNQTSGVMENCMDMKKAIDTQEDIGIVCDDPDGIHYLGISADAPWAFSEKVRNMSRNEYKTLLRKYINMITDEKLEIKWWSVSDDCDW